MHLSEEMMRETAVFVRFHVNVLLSVFNDIVHRKDTKLFYTMALCLWMISMVSGLIDILTLGYASKCFSWHLMLLKSRKEVLENYLI